MHCRFRLFLFYSVSYGYVNSKISMENFDKRNTNESPKHCSVVQSEKSPIIWSNYVVTSTLSKKSTRKEVKTEKDLVGGRAVN